MHPNSSKCHVCIAVGFVWTSLWKMGKGMKTPQPSTDIRSKNQVHVSLPSWIFLHYHMLLRMPGSLCAGNQMQSKLASIPEARDILRSEMLMMCRACIAKTGNLFKYMPIIWGPLGKHRGQGQLFNLSLQRDSSVHSFLQSFALFWSLLILHPFWQIPVSWGLGPLGSQSFWHPSWKLNWRPTIRPFWPFLILLVSIFFVSSCDTDWNPTAHQNGTCSNKRP